MTALLRRVHTWVGLFNLTALVVFALTGIAVSLPEREDEREPDVRFVDYTAPDNLTDKQIADEVFARLQLPVSSPLPDWAVGRNDANVLVLQFHGLNGAHEVTVLEAERRLKVAHVRNSLGTFLNFMHATTLYASSPDLRVRLWALYVDTAIWSLLFMSVTGPWLWLASRPRLWWARLAFLAGCGVFAALWFVTR